MKCIVILLSAMAALVGSEAFADDKPGIPDEIIKAMDYFVGTWEAKGNVGDKVRTGGITLRWSPTKDGTKVCLIGRFSYTTGDETLSGTNIIGWNAAKKCLEDRGFNDLGGSGTLYWFPKSEHLLKGEIIYIKDGEEVHAKADLVKKGEAEIVMETVTEDGEVGRVEYTKVKKERKKRKE